MPFQKSKYGAMPCQTVFQIAERGRFHSGALVVNVRFPQGTKCHIRGPGQAQQELAFILQRVRFPDESAFHLLLALPGEVLVIEFRVPGTLLVIIISWRICFISFPSLATMCKRDSYFFLAYISYIAYNILNKGAGRIACTYPLRRYVLSYKVTVQPLAGEWTVIFCAWNYSQAL